MIEELRAKLKRNRRSYKWFIATYFQGYTYTYIMTQINGFARMQENTKETIENYLKEPDEV